MGAWALEFEQVHALYVEGAAIPRCENDDAEADGSFRMVIAHDDPGVANWIDTEGRGFGMVFWRFFLPEGEVETPVAEVVKRAEVR